MSSFYWTVFLLDIVKDMGSEFLKCYLALAEGEKDPRNLQIAFALDRILLLEFDITDLVEQFYDITFCYFPITFKAPANDPYGVSGTDLVQALKECLSASPLLGPPGMPLFIEKLNVGSPATKRDTMETIEACLPVYGPAVCQSFADKLWDGLKIEILQPVDDEVQKRALAVMVALVRTSHPTDGPVDGIALRILRSSLEILKEPEKARSQNAVKVLASLVSCSGKSQLASDTSLLTFSDHVAAWIWEPLITQLLESYDKATEQSTRVVVLETFASMLEAQLAASSSPDAKIPLPLLAQKDAVLSRFVSSLSSPATSEPSLDSIQKLIRLRILSQDEFRYVAHSLTNSLLDMCVSDDDLSFEIVSVLQHLAVVSSEIVEGVTLPALFALLPDDAASLSDETARGRCIHSLSVLETLCVAPALFSRLSVHLLTKLEMLVNGQEHTGSEAANATIAYGHALLRTIYTALSKKSEAQDPDVPRYIERFVPQLYALFVQPPPRGPEHRINLLETVLIKDASDIISVVVASLGIERQKAWLQALFAAFFASEPGDLSPLFAAGLIGLRPETPIPVPDINELLRRITSVALSTENEGGRRALLTVAASILNKHGNECSAFINEDLETLWEERISRASPPEPRRAALEVWTMMVQALVVRNHPRGVALSMKLFTLFDDADMAENAARSLGRIPGLEGTVLVKKYHATIRLLYAQKLFSAITPEISKAMGLEPHAATKSLPYLIALSILIPSLPKGTYGQTIETVTKLDRWKFPTLTTR
ncbi:related to Transcriptional coactivator MMS19 [Serendipita indica DSM 11827]|uniref:MMS19 nucleotide excision repair protein n=1 Tax=Serendipita indica (strain DSM 11827) TaxID=1109443 RepID=G4TMX5_SERID|nr:related to Transcriptional coactivator MMS19 [Serendipita indica DSM 11827]